MKKQNNRANQAKDVAVSSHHSATDPTISDAELEELGTQLEMSAPAPMINQTFRASLLSKLMDIQASQRLKKD